MSVYVDALLPSVHKRKWPYPEACHLLADSIKELHEFAEQLGLKKSWFQRSSLPHYDLTKGMRTKAVQQGAIEIDRDGFGKILRKYRLEGYPI